MIVKYFLFLPIKWWGFIRVLFPFWVISWQPVSCDPYFPHQLETRHRPTTRVGGCEVRGIKEYAGIWSLLRQCQNTIPWSHKFARRRQVPSWTPDRSSFSHWRSVKLDFPGTAVGPITDTTGIKGPTLLCTKQYIFTKPVGYPSYILCLRQYFLNSRCRRHLYWPIPYLSVKYVSEVQ